MGSCDDFIATNVNLIHSMNKGSPPRERIELPEGVDVFPYSSQKLNIWDF